MNRPNCYISVLIYNRYPPVSVIRKTESVNTDCVKKLKAVSVGAVKAFKGSRNIGSLILKLDTTWRLVVNFTPRSL